MNYEAFLLNVLNHYNIPHPHKIIIDGFTRWGRNNRYYALILPTKDGSDLFGVHIGDFTTGESISAFNRKPLLKEKKWAREAVEQKQKALAEKEHSRMMGIWRDGKALEGAHSHPYLVAKKIGKIRGIKTLLMGEKGNCLIIPMMNIEKKLNGIQIIEHNTKADGKVFPRRFLSGSRASESFFPINTPSPEKHLFICEGISTAASVAIATGEPCLAAFAAFNLPKVAKLFFDNGYKNITIAADNDCHIDHGNIGIEKAKACLPYAKKIVYPPVSFSKNGEGIDFNDIFVEYGAEAVRGIIYP